MKSIKELRDNLKRSPSDCTGIDIGATVIKVVRLKTSGDNVTILGADLIKPAANGHIIIPANLRARYASIATSGNNAIIKLLTFPGAIESSFKKSLPQKLGIIDDEDFRLSYNIITEGNSRTESSVLAAALPEEEAKAVMHHFASGIPAPYSLEITSLATLHAFEYGPVANDSGETASLIDFGTHTTSLSVFYKKKLVLIRFFEFGTKIVMERLKSTLRINTDTALGILDDSSFDVSDLLMELMGSIASHLIVSRDFVERQNNCSIDMLYAVGGIAMSRAAMQSLSKAMNIKVKAWDPFEGYNIEPQTITKDVEEQHWRFAGAIGAARATLEEK
jgi:Tfp pilus assembly PilM family ATPase